MYALEIHIKTKQKEFNLNYPFCTRNQINLYYYHPQLGDRIRCTVFVADQPKSAYVNLVQCQTRNSALPRGTRSAVCIYILYVHQPFRDPAPEARLLGHARPRSARQRSRRNFRRWSCRSRWAVARWCRWGGWGGTTGTSSATPRRPVRESGSPVAASGFLCFVASVRP